MAENDAAPAPEKRKRGRPKIKLAPTTLYDLPGRTKEEKLAQVLTMWSGCKKCLLGEMREQANQALALRGSRAEPKDIVFGDGNTDAHVLIVGEAPGAEEERDRVPFVGPAGRFLNQILAQVSDDPEILQLSREYSERSATENDPLTIEFHNRIFEWRASEFFITNVVSCRPPDNRQPTLPEMRTCWERLWNIIYIVDPLLIVACGNTALATVTQKQSVQITKMRGQLFDVEYQGKVGKLVYPVMPVLHPSFLQRAADWKTKDGFYTKTVEDWRKAMEILDILRLRHFGTPIPVRRM